MDPDMPISVDQGQTADVKVDDQIASLEERGAESFESIAHDPLEIQEYFEVEVSNEDQNQLTTDGKKITVESSTSEPAVAPRKSDKPNNPKNIFSCDFCGETYGNRTDITKHLQKHIDPRPQCNVCWKRLANTGELFKHLRTHGVQKKNIFSCDFCGETYSNRTDITKHLQKHIDLRPQCYVCQKRLANNSELFKHLKAHSKTPRKTQKILECQHCGKYFSHLGNVLRHEAIHTGGNFMCEFCGKSFVQKAQLRHHILLHHFKIRPHTCNTCGKSYTTKANLTLHMTVHSKDFRFECEICGKKSRLSSAHKIHLLTHLSTGESTCQQCGLVFITKRELNIHLQTHSSMSKIYGCDVCGKHYARPQGLKKHMVNKHNSEEEDPLIIFICREASCRKRFKEKKQLEKHEKTHDRKVLSCADCEETFATREEWRAHRLVHILPPEFPCMLCPEGFADSILLRRHLIVSHRMIMKNLGPTYRS